MVFELSLEKEREIPLKMFVQPIYST